MKSVHTLLIVALLSAAGAVAQDRAANAEPTKETPAHTPEWTDHNESDPGVTVMEVDVAGDTAGNQVSPSQRKVLVAPSAGETEGKTDKASGTIRFGNGEHGRIPQKNADPGGRSEIIMEDKAGDESWNEDQAEGDPDRPVISGRVPNPEDDK